MENPDLNTELLNAASAHIRRVRDAAHAQRAPHTRLPLLAGSQQPMGTVRAGVLDAAADAARQPLAALGFALEKIPFAAAHAHPDAPTATHTWALTSRHAPYTPSAPLAQNRAGWGVLGGEAATHALSAALNALARTLHERGVCMAWRDEQIAVHAWNKTDFSPTPIATIERAAVRTLGIATQAVHLVGYVGDLPTISLKQQPSAWKNVQIWLQQRSPTKPTHPSRWDTLMGGMCAASDALHGQQHIENIEKIPLSLRTHATSLVRETWEEAGLKINDLHDLRAGHPIDITTAAGATEPSLATQATRIAACTTDAGWVRERIHWASARVPPHLQPENRDGEVAQFARLSAAAVLHRIAHGQCTPEAVLVLADFLGFNG